MDTIIEKDASANEILSKRSLQQLSTYSCIAFMYENQDLYEMSIDETVVALVAA
jgi:hypothetical protein